MIDFHAPAMVAAAKAHVASWRWRLAVGAVFALGAALALGSFQVGVSWFLAIALATGFDALLGRSYLEARSRRDRSGAGAMFAWGCAFSVMVSVGMMLHVASQGGGAGRLLAALMATSVFVSAMLFLFRAPAFMTITAAPAGLSLLIMPFLPLSAAQVDPLYGALGVICGAAGFLAYVLRAAIQNEEMVKNLAQANAHLRTKRAEAELKRAEAEEANRAKSEFLAVMTHELRTPLNAVIGYSEIIKEDIEAVGRTPLADDAARITHAAQHLLGLIDQILHLSSVDAGQEPIAPRDVDVRRLVDDAANAVSNAVRAQGGRLSVRVSDEAARAFVDGGKLAVCVGALLSNAAKFCGDGLIAITAERSEAAGGDRLTISVSDTGMGIAADDLARIFEPFVQLDHGKTRAKDGLGLGLSVARRMARALGGDIRVRSEVGRGSTFEVSVPMRAKVLSAATARTAA
jgi:signal transduction histidine kinase